MRLLVVEDEVDLAAAVAKGLRKEGYAVDVAHNVDQATDKLLSNAYDLVCIDWNLPGVSGRELCRQLADGVIRTLEGFRPKLIMLTARDTIEDRVSGLDAGADDYLIKPFAFVELAARTRALLRRDERTPPILQVGELNLDPIRFHARRGGRVLQLTPKEFALLEYFMTKPGAVLSQETLLEHVWDEMADPFTNTVRVTLSNLRKKLGDPALIQTIPRRGYVLNA